MGLISWIKGKFSRDKPQNSFWFRQLPFLFGTSDSGKFVDDVTAMSNSVVLACVKVLSESVASLPLHLYRYAKNGKERASACTAGKITEGRSKKHHSLSSKIRLPGFLKKNSA